MRGSILTFLVLILIIIAGYVAFTLVRPIKPISPTLNSISKYTLQTKSGLTWPTAGQSAVGVVNSNILLTNKLQAPAPTASTAKMLTALMVLKVKPLALNEQGPTITLGSADVQLYKNYAAAQGSVVPVADGEKITQYQMLQAMLLPSANNMADSLAIWAYGSLENYSLAANSYVKELGLNNTHIGSDASGFSPTTTSTASDLVKIGEIVMSNPVLASIVNQQTATGIPMTTTVKNVNYLLGTNNVIGIKTGNTDQAGGVYISAAKVSVSGHDIVIVSANVGAGTIGQAISGSLPLIQSSQKNIISVSPIIAGKIIGYYYMPWSKQKVNISVKTNLKATLWGGGNLSLSKTLSSINKGQPAGTVVGSIKPIGSSVLYPNSSQLVTSQAIKNPPIWWKLTHPNFGGR